MHVKKIAACVLGATMFWQSSTLVLASEQVLPVLTLEKAIEQAKNTSLDLQIHEINYELSKESAEMADLIGGYYAGLTPKMQAELMRRNTSVLEDALELEIMSMFDQIILSEEQVNLTKIEIELTKKNIKKAEIEFKNGLKSELELHTLKLQLEQQEKELQKVEESITLSYDKLCDKIGTRSKRYALDKGEIVYKPYRDVVSIDGFASDKAEDHISLWHAIKSADIAQETPVFSQDYMTVIQGKANREITQKEIKLTEQALEQSIKQMYIDTKQVESSYEMAKKNVELQEKQLQVNKVYLEKGMLSPLEYEEGVLAYERALLNLMQLESKHAILCYQLDHPYLISSRSIK